MKKVKTEKNKERLNGEIISEVFDIEKDGKEKEVIVQGVKKEGIKKVSKEQIKNQKKVFLIVLGIMGIITLMFVVFILIVNSSRSIDYKGVKFMKIKEGELIFYQTSIPVMYNGKETSYNFYLRKDPRTQEKIEFNATGINFKKILVINVSTNELNCDGDRVIGIANLAKLYEVMGANVIRDENATCDSDGRYNYINVVKGEKTRIVGYGTDKDCFTIEVKDCEILQGLEKFMLETFVKINKEW